MRNLIDKIDKINDGSRTLFESIVVPEVNLALKDWSSTQKNCVLIGGCALGYYVRPRSTLDVDVLFLAHDDIPNSVPGFKHTRTHAFQHNSTHVEVEVITPEFVQIPHTLVEKVFETAVESDGIKIASPSGLIALKLGRFSRQDQADIESLLVLKNIDVDHWPLDEKSRARWEEVKTWSDGND